MEQLIRGQDALAASKPYSVECLLPSPSSGENLDGRLYSNPIDIFIFTSPSSIHDGGLLT